MASFEMYLEFAEDWAKNHRAELEAIEKSGWLSPKGKLAERDHARARYDSMIIGKRADAERDLKHDRELAAAKLARVRAEAAEAERSLLGIEIAFRILEKRIDGMNAVQVLAALTDARDEWEREIVRQLGLAWLSTLDAGLFGSDEQRAYSEFFRLAQAPANSKEQAIIDELAKIDRDLEKLDHLDPIAHESDLNTEPVRGE